MKIQLNWKRNVPWAMVFSRAALAPVVVLISRIRPNGLLLVSCVVFALLTGLFDGILSLRWRVANSLLRRCDTVAGSRSDAFVILVYMLRYSARLRSIMPLLLAPVAL